MSLKYLLDTNIVSEQMRPRPRAAVVTHLEQHASELAIASVVWQELWFGCLRLPRSARRTAIEQYLDGVIGRTMSILPYDERAAEWHASERARLTGAGKTPAFEDGQIAAIAAVNELTLVTFNTRDFKEFNDISVTDWAS